MPQRDSQRSKVYKAEWSTHFTSSVQFNDLRDIMIAVSKVLQDPRMIQRYPFIENQMPSISIDNRIKGAYCMGNKLVFQQGSMKTWIMLHEITHWVRWKFRRSQSIVWMRSNPEPPAHGWEFCKAYIDIIGLFLSYKEMDALKESFRKFGVRYKAPRQISEATRAMLKLRMTQMQEKKAAARSLFCQPYDMSADYAKE